MYPTYTGTFGPTPLVVQCPKCGANVVTDTRPSPGTITFILACLLCCLPFCFARCQNVNHYCPDCKVYLATFLR
uniref:LITAF domain-containing protein n=1 Tax=Strigamia maritima TaxID=126957 RepID=T1JEW2_STRMM